MVKKTSKFLLKFAILAMALNEVASGAVAPAMDVLIDKFQADYSITVIMMITTAPQMCLIIVAPLFGLLADKFKRRHLLFFSLFAFVIGGMGPAFVDSLPLIIAFRILIGIGIAILLPLSLLLIDDFFGDTHEKDSLIGLNQTMQMVGGTVFQLLGGFLADIQWNYIFFVYAFPVWIIVLCFFTIPEPEKKAKAVAAVNGVKEKLPASIFVVFIGYVLFHICFFNLVTNTAVMVTASGFGTAGESGIALSVMTVASFVAGIVYGFIYKLSKKITLPLGCLAMALGFAVLFIAPNLWVCFIGTGLAGFGMGIVMPAFMSKSTELAPPSRVGMSLSWMIAAMGLGQFLSPLVFNPFLDAVGLHIGREGLGVAAAMGAVLTVLYFIWNYFLEKPYKKEEASA